MCRAPTSAGHSRGSSRRTSQSGQKQPWQGSIVRHPEPAHPLEWEPVRQAQVQAFPAMLRGGVTPVTEHPQADSCRAPGHAAGTGRAQAVQAVKSSLQMGHAHHQQQSVMDEIPTAAGGVPSTLQGVGCHWEQPEADSRAQPLQRRLLEPHHAPSGSAGTHDTLGTATDGSLAALDFPVVTLQQLAAEDAAAGVCQAAAGRASRSFQSPKRRAAGLQQPVAPQASEQHAAAQAQGVVPHQAAASSKHRGRGVKPAAVVCKQAAGASCAMARPPEQQHRQAATVDAVASVRHPSPMQRRSGSPPQRQKEKPLSQQGCRDCQSPRQGEVPAPLAGGSSQPTSQQAELQGPMPQHEARGRARKRAAPRQQRMQCMQNWVRWSKEGDPVLEAVLQRRSGAGASPGAQIRSRSVDHVQCCAAAAATPAAACSCKATLQVLAATTCIVELPGPLPSYSTDLCRSHSPKRLMSPRHAPQRPASAHAGVFQAAAASEALPSAELPVWDDSPPSAQRTLRSLSPQHRLHARATPPHKRPPQRRAASAATQRPAGPSVATRLQQWWQPLAQVHSARLQPDGGDWRQGLREAWMATPHESVRFQLGTPQPAVAAGPWEQAETRWVL